ncbi:prepilin-type N-terminal cleavage/methylation domain-containing protein [Microcoleus sp. FACHB-831]|uniref:type IV pilin-like G/H family protein n=1 Tax=Microcoleus sp. FACHB-831 TaxID=2692827 RepID=UPI001682269C|nr:type IV pilin-like G/H family protein [Microcoleus sp. FACHB-831]MBD1919693.1 prepilin-type N-terminal cleavage/methylation domain-containing protein [Microcoleus sp. FACHB-831]
MNMAIRVQLLKYLLNKHQHRGFTLIELLVVMLVIGILAALALPSFLNCANTSKKSESKTYVYSLNKGQQAYYTEKEKFSNSIAALGVGIPPRTANYQYSTKSTKTAAFNYGIAKNKGLKSDIGGVFLTPDNNIDSKTGNDNMTIQMTTQTILCEANSADISKISVPSYQNGVMTCGDETRRISP